MSRRVMWRIVMHACWLMFVLLIILAPFLAYVSGLLDAGGALLGYIALGFIVHVFEGGSAG
ncbi:hypothetical protein M4H08_001927 [Listeria monocytogenes]|uniref:hypothetical protein n=1 Tax=Listeria seeligeri TaxID=1640 RepID=UPI0017E566E1|nr:hypothetical protein [Listeria seeligeri]EJE1078089.1 hypothetical protein [Listeria monocytogenes]EJE1814582.1 hypothetical protein [Listeria monocytogenes]EKZ3968266.1 hypothetical protein [Listeria monocytogenes]EKZ4000272.1 hypothetical protein [Listeria monocytogenes]EKZ4005988.1 hypothetical protein [Listeria monocytogenes]